jgi:long-chain acyl-CoA synthetase
MTARTTHEAFETGLQARPKGICLGFRPLVSTSPLKYADAYSWLTYEQVSQRRYNLGSAIEGLFRARKAGGGELPTVGIWCINRPGEFESPL